MKEKIELRKKIVLQKIKNHYKCTIYCGNRK